MPNNDFSALEYFVGVAYESCPANPLMEGETLDGLIGIEFSQHQIMARRAKWSVLQAKALMKELELSSND